MRIVAIFKRWIEILAALLLAWRESRRERRSLIVTYENGQVVVRQSDAGRDAMLRDTHAAKVTATLKPGAGIPADVSRAAQDSLVVLEFPADKVVMRRITVPEQARKFLSGVVRNQIERLSPWPVNGVLYGFSTEAGTGDAAAVEVRVLMAARGDIDAARRDLAALGLSVDRYVDAMRVRGRPAHDPAERGPPAPALGESGRAEHIRVHPDAARLEEDLSTDLADVRTLHPPQSDDPRRVDRLEWDA